MRQLHHHIISRICLKNINLELEILKLDFSNFAECIQTIKETYYLCCQVILTPILNLSQKSHVNDVRLFSHNKSRLKKLD